MDTFFHLVSNSIKECSTQLQPLLQNLDHVMGTCSKGSGLLLPYCSRVQCALRGRYPPKRSRGLLSVIGRSLAESRLFWKCGAMASGPAPASDCSCVGAEQVRNPRNARKATHVRGAGPSGRTASLLHEPVPRSLPLLIGRKPDCLQSRGPNCVQPFEVVSRSAGLLDHLPKEPDLL